MHLHHNGIQIWLVSQPLPHHIPLQKNPGFDILHDSQKIMLKSMMLIFKVALDFCFAITDYFSVGQGNWDKGHE